MRAEAGALAFTEVLARLHNLALHRFGPTGHTSVSVLADSNAFTVVAEWTNGVDRKQESGEAGSLWRSCETLAAALKGERPPLPGYKRAPCYACKGARAPRCGGCQGRGWTDILMVYQIDEQGNQR